MKVDEHPQAAHELDQGVCEELCELDPQFSETWGTQLSKMTLEASAS